MGNGGQSIVINGQNVARVTECKYLGIVLDENLTFMEHVKYVTKKVNILCRIGNLLTTWAKVMIPV